MVMKVTILGDGGWGTALSLLLVRKGESVTLWGAFPDYVEEVRQSRDNRKFLAGIFLPPSINLTADIGRALEGSAAVILAVPSQFVRSVCEKAIAFRGKDCLVISATKGLEMESRRRISEVIEEVWGPCRLAVISGPSHAEEVARGLPTTVVAASRDPEVARQSQELLMEERFRVYTHDDVLGVELGGAIKNVIAIAAGICDGLGFGDNTKAALLTRGMVEIARLGKAAGARPETLWGLSGIGDLIATSFSPYGRNLKLGRMIGRGFSLEEALKSTDMVVEGVKTAPAAYQLACELGVEMPITREICRVLYENKLPLDAVKDLMTREARAEGPP